MFNSSNLVILAVVMSTISLALSSASVWPSWKDGLAKIRDAILWTALVFVAVGAANYYWRTSDLRRELWQGASQQESYNETRSK